jgi:Flp pilus assembly protein TadG
MKTKMTIKNQKGAALVEFAIVLPLLVLLLFGAIEFGILYYNKQVITNASREGARAGIIAYERDDYYKANSEIKDIVKYYCIKHLITFSGSPDLEDSDITLVPGDRTDSNTSFIFGSSFKVTVAYDYDFLLPSLFGFGDILTISATTMMKREGSL